MAEFQEKTDIPGPLVMEGQELLKLGHRAMDPDIPYT